MRSLRKRSTENPFAAVAPFLPPNPTIIEAGASIGMDIPPLLEMWPEASVHAFEPEPATYAELERRVSSDPRVSTWQLALGADEGSIQMHVSHGEYGTMSSSLLEPTITLEAHPQTTYTTVDVRQQTLSAWCAENDVKPDLLALDMQGYEYAALDASREILRSASVILTEAFLVPMYDGAATVDQMQALLASEGFVIWTMDARYARTFNMCAIRRDVLLSRREADRNGIVSNGHRQQG